MTNRFHLPALALFIFSVVFVGEYCSAAEFHVSPKGDASGDGSPNKPFVSLEKAKTAARAAAKPVTIWLHGGTYYLPETLALSAEDSQTTWRAAANETPVLSGGVRIHLDWTPYKDGIVQAKVPENFATDQLFVNGQLQPLARYPNFDPNQRVFNGYAKDAISPQRAARWSDPAGGFIHAMHSAQWGGMHYRITGKEENNNLKYEGGWQNNRASGMHRDLRFVENIFEELDAPGEWFLNAKTNTLYYYPPEGLNLAKATIEAVRLRHLIELRGAKSVSLRGITVRHAARTFMENKEPLLRSDWTTYRGGAVLLEQTEDCSIEDATFDQLGGNAIFINNHNRRVTIRGCHIHRVGGNGVAFVGNQDAVRNGITWKERNEFAKIDKTPGPKSDNYPADCLVEDCLIHETGRVEKQTAPVQIEMAESITVRHCSVYDVPRAGINIGDGCWGGHIIEFCDVFDTVKETGDHGSFNSWGRDRFWGLANAPAGELPTLALLDVVKVNTLRNNRWRCDHGWDVDLDDGSSRYEIYNNLFLSGGLKLREGFHRKVWNNITFNNSFHPHVWYDNCGDVVTNNIWMGAYRPAGGMPKGKWGQEVDRNLFTSDADRQRFAANGCDANSVVGDPRFVNPAEGDFRVQDDSPALKVGFKNFPMDQFGVQKASLKKIARTAPFEKGHAAAPKRDPAIQDWQGLRVRNIIGPGEMSVYGTTGETGVLILELPGDHPFVKAGVKKNDVLVEINEQPIRDAHDLQKFDKPARLRILREQQAIDISP